MAREFLARVVNTAHTRRYMSLVDGQGSKFYGLAPNRSLDGVADGDSVVILQGCSVPVVLRLSKRCKHNCWELIGECFVYGVMDGEVMLDKSYRSRLTEFELV